MELLLSNGFLFIELLITVSLCTGFQLRSISLTCKKSYMQVCVFYAISLTAAILMNFVSFPTLGYLLYSISWFGNMCWWISLLMISTQVGCEDSKTLQFCTNLLMYGMCAVYFADTLFGKGRMVSSKWGNVYRPVNNVLKLLHVLVFVVFITAILAIYSRKFMLARRRREQYEMRLFTLAYLPCVLGAVLNIQILAVFNLCIPIIQIFGIISIVAFYYLLPYYRSIQFEKEDYVEWLSSDRHDLVFICDDQFYVKFENKRAEVVAQMARNEFIGQKIQDIFLVSQESEENMMSSENQSTFGISGVYPSTDQKIDMIIRRIPDRYGEIFANIVTILDMDANVVSTLDSSVEEVGEEELETSIRITKDAKVLIFSEKMKNIETIEKLLSPYQMQVFFVKEAEKSLPVVKEQRVDIMLIDHRFKGGNGFSFAKKIRELGNGYYKEVPIVLCTDSNINDVYKEFIDVGFSDYLVEPISAKQMRLVLTRWLWKRFSDMPDKDAESEENVQTVQHTYKEYAMEELQSLANDAYSFYQKKEWLLVQFCIQGICRICGQMEYEKVETQALDALNAVRLSEYDVFEGIYSELIKDIKRVIS